MVLHSAGTPSVDNVPSHSICPVAGALVWSSDELGLCVNAVSQKREDVTTICQVVVHLRQIDASWFPCGAGGASCACAYVAHDHMAITIATPDLNFPVPWLHLGLKNRAILCAKKCRKASN